MITDIYLTIINEPLYISGVVLIFILTVFSLIKKLVKFTIVLIVPSVLFVGYIYNTGQDSLGSAEKNFKNVSKKTEEAVEAGKKKLKELEKKLD